MSDEPLPAKFVSPSPQPTAHQREVAVVLIEECGEIVLECAQVIQRATKLLRFGVHLGLREKPRCSGRGGIADRATRDSACMGN